jgi:Flp pilus assembly protein TadD
MIHCPACNAENPVGTKLCVKCGTELPKTAPVGSAEAKKTAALAGAPTASLGDKVRHASHDLVDALWLVLILFLVFFGFWGEATHWTFSLVEKLPIRLAGQPAEPAPAMQIVQKSHKATKKAAVEKPVAVAPVAQVPQEKSVAPSASPEKLYDLSKSKFDHYDYNGSFKLLKQALNTDPTFARAYFGLGYLYARFDMDNTAVRMYEMALRFNPRHAESINNLAMMYLGAGNKEDAQTLLQKAVEIDPQNPDFHYNLGTMYLDEQKWAEAESELTKASGARPKDASILNDLALTFEAQGKKDDALATWKRVLDCADDPALMKQAHAHMEFLKQS